MEETKTISTRIDTEHVNTGHDPLDIFGKKHEFTEILDELSALSEILSLTTAADDDDVRVSSAVLKHLGRVAIDCQVRLRELFPDVDATRDPLDRRKA